MQSLTVSYFSPDSLKKNSLGRTCSKQVKPKGCAMFYTSKIIKTFGLNPFDTGAL